MKRKAVYQIVENAETRTADINIYGDITSAAELYRNWGCSEGEVSARDVKQAIEGLDVDTINVYINSYGGEVAEALAIYSSLKRHSAQIHTFCDGFACSAATIVFCAGDVRTMGAIALLMIHNCMSYLGYANSEEMRKAAEDNDKINQSSIEAYKSVCNLTEDEIKEKMNAETWLTAQECLDFGFATEIADQEEEDEETQQTAFSMIRQAVLGAQNQKGDAIMQKLDDIQATLDGMKNSAKAAGQWWEPQHKWDRPPAELASKPGFLSGYSDDFLNAIKPVRVRTALNTVTDAAVGTYEDTYDKIFLASLEQEFITPQASGIEGEAWDYWKQAVERSTPTPWYKTFAEGGHPITYGIDGKTSAQSVRLRSASRGGANGTWLVSASGGVGSVIYAVYSNRFAPACVIC